MTLRYWKILYVLASLLYVGYWVRVLLSLPVADRNPHVSAFVVCLLVFIVPPATGYFLIFKLLPWTARWIRRQA